MIQLTFSASNLDELNSTIHSYLQSLGYLPKLESSCKEPKSPSSRKKFGDKKDSEVVANLVVPKVESGLESVALSNKQSKQVETLKPTCRPALLPEENEKSADPNPVAPPPTTPPPPFVLDTALNVVDQAKTLVKAILDKYGALESALGTEICASILTRFGCRKLSELKRIHYLEFIELAQNALDTGKPFEEYILNT